MNLVQASPGAEWHCVRNKARETIRHHLLPPRPSASSVPIPTGESITEHDHTEFEGHFIDTLPAFQIPTPHDEIRPMPSGIPHARASKGSSRAAIALKQAEGAVGKRFSVAPLRHSCTGACPERSPISQRRTRGPDGQRSSPESAGEAEAIARMRSPSVTGLSMIPATLTPGSPPASANASL